MTMRDGSRDIRVLEAADLSEPLKLSEWSVARGTLLAQIGASDRRITTFERLVLLLPVLMWIAAALITWLLVSRLLIRPLKRLEQAVIRYEPGQALDLPSKLGPSEEIQELRDAFARAVARVDASDSDKTAALEGQRRLVREVHHRVKNNLQVVASLLNIHGRNATAAEARSAYAGISRRVGALSIVHRNHFAEMEENRGIAMRPLLTELAAELRAGAPEVARSLRIDLELDGVNTTQDVAVAVAFLVTEMVEFAMLHCPSEPIEIALRRTSELTARLTLSSPVLVPEEDALAEKVQFERIIAGLAKQLRSALERKLGRYSVDLPIFPAILVSLAQLVTAMAKKMQGYCEKRGTHCFEAALCSSDSDLLPPRSRYPFKWARNRQPSPPPVALPGPLLSGAQPQQSLTERPSGPLASA